MLLREGVSGDDVKTLQGQLQDAGLYKLDIDGDYGPGTARAVRFFQQVAMITDDSMWGSRESQPAFEKLRDGGWGWGKPWRHESGIWVYGWRHPDLDLIPDREGRCSYFGGPEDKWDRGFGQALINAENAAELYDRYGDLVEQGMFRKDAEGRPFTDPLPDVYAWRGGSGENAKWGWKTAGISWLLNDHSFYCAMRWRRGKFPDPRRHRAVFFYKGHTVVIAPSDFGPAKWTEKTADLSPGGLEALTAATGKVIKSCWAADEHKLGKAGRDIPEDYQP